MYRSTSITLLLGISLYWPTAYLTASLLVDTYCFWPITVTNNANTSFYTDFCAHVLVTINLAALHNGNVLTTKMYSLIAGEPRRSKSGCQQVVLPKALRENPVCTPSRLLEGTPDALYQADPPEFCVCLHLACPFSLKDTSHSSWDP